MVCCCCVVHSFVELVIEFFCLVLVICFLRCERNGFEYKKAWRRNTHNYCMSWKSLSDCP